MGLGRGWACIGIQLAIRIGQVGPRGPVRAEWGLVGPSRAE